MAVHTYQTHVGRILQLRTMKNRKVYSQDDLAKAVCSLELSMPWDTVRKVFPDDSIKNDPPPRSQQRSGVAIKRTGPPPVLSQELKTTSRRDRTVAAREPPCYV